MGLDEHGAPAYTIDPTGTDSIWRTFNFKTFLHLGLPKQAMKKYIHGALKNPALYFKSFFIVCSTRYEMQNQEPTK